MWKAPFSMLLHGHDLYSYLDGSTPSPSLTIITGIVTSANPAGYISKNSWDALHVAYANKSQTRIFSLRDRLMRLTKESQPVTKYLQAIRSISDELSTAGALVSNSELIVKILSGLGSEFHKTFAAIRACDSTITYEELYEKLLDHELFL
ncbi:uncharacterized protein LOC124898021 [Capsicum annuum]|uniref:uncharacterized protein LOC124898021 n=1 Tax=Capsicum annuum TaxID=4072 RepID=UPI001FB0BE64|nr:uncharacterized protein LOC124898021 [Capsicum annuum]